MVQFNYITDPNAPIPTVDAAQVSAALAAASADLSFIGDPNIIDNVVVSWGTIQGQTIPDTSLTQGGPDGIAIPYDVYRAFLIATAAANGSPIAQAAANSMPVINPEPTRPYVYVAGAQAKALGILAPNDTSTDGFVGINPVLFSAPYSALDAGAIIASEVARSMGVYIGDGYTSPTYSGTLDYLMNSQGAMGTDPSQPRILSFNDGQTSWGQWQTTAAGDPSKLLDGSMLGVASDYMPVTATDQDIFASLGWQVVNAANPIDNIYTPWAPVTNITADNIQSPVNLSFANVTNSLVTTTGSNQIFSFQGSNSVIVNNQGAALTAVVDGAANSLTIEDFSNIAGVVLNPQMGYGSTAAVLNALEPIAGAPGDYTLPLYPNGSSSGSVTLLGAPSALAAADVFKFG